MNEKNENLVLMAGEKIEYVAKYKFHLIRSILLLLLSIEIIIIQNGVPLAIFLILLIVIFVLQVVTYKYIVTNYRVFIRIGLLSKRIFEIKLEDIEGVSCEQGLLGQWLNYGEIIIRGNSATSPCFPNIEDPMAFKRSIDNYSQERKKELKLNNPNNGVVNLKINLNSFPK